MSNSGVLSVSGPGRGIRYPSPKTVFIARATVVVGGVYMLCEHVGASPDSASVTTANSNADAGALANVIAPNAAVAAGMTAAAASELGTLVLAAEAAASGSPFFGWTEAYYVDALCTTAASRIARCSLYPLTTSVLRDTGTAVGSPAVGRLLQDVGTITGTLAKVHFCGLPGGFGVGPGT